MIDYVSCSHGTYLNRMLIYPTSPEQHGFQMEATRQVKQAVNGMPVVGVGRIVTPEEAEKHLAAGDCDFVAMARALIADPRMGGEGGSASEAAEIRPCVGANWCMTSIFAQAPIACIHNPAAGNETELSADGTLKRGGDAEERRGGRRRPGRDARGADGGEARASRDAVRARGTNSAGRCGCGRARRAAWSCSASWTGCRRRSRRPASTVRLQTVATEDMLRAAGHDVVIVATGARGPAPWLDAAAAGEVGRRAVVPGTDQPNVLFVPGGAARGDAARRARAGL